MMLVLIFFIFIIFVGLAGSVLRKKFYKKLLSLSLSLNALVVFSGIMANFNNNIPLRVFSLCLTFIIALVMGSTFYICYEEKRRKRQ